jgi:hypothetical protein
MMSPNEYRQRARECVQAAAVTDEPDLKAALLTLAENWTLFADRAERAEASPKPKTPWAGPGTERRTDHRSRA